MDLSGEGARPMASVQEAWHDHLQIARLHSHIWSAISGRCEHVCPALPMHKIRSGRLPGRMWSELPTVLRALDNRAPSRRSGRLHRTLRDLGRRRRCGCSGWSTVPVMGGRRDWESGLLWTGRSGLSGGGITSGTVQSGSVRWRGRQLHRDVEPASSARGDGECSVVCLGDALNDR